MTTARKIIKKAMQKAKVLTMAENPTASEASDGLDTLNDLLASWSTEPVLIYARTKESFPIVGNVSQYSIGSGQTFNTEKPIFINAAYTRAVSGDDQPVTVITDESYALIVDKSARGRPRNLNFNNGYPTALIELWPVPDTSYTLHLLTEKPLAQFTLDQEVILPPGTERALIYNLGIELAPEYGQEPSPTMIKIAADSKRNIKAAIMRNRTMDVPSQVSSPNILTGYW